MGPLSKSVMGVFLKGKKKEGRKERNGIKKARRKRKSQGGKEERMEG